MKNPYSKGCLGLISTLLFVWALAGCGSAPASAPSPAPTVVAITASTAMPLTTLQPVSSSGSGQTSVEQAHGRLVEEGLKMTLVLVSDKSTGTEGDVYRDLRFRDIRATTGTNEGIDTHSLACYPYCVFVPVEEANALKVEAWEGVLRHEYRHMLQASNNPTLAQDFREPAAGPLHLLRRADGGLRRLRAERQFVIPCAGAHDAAADGAGRRAESVG